MTCKYSPVEDSSPMETAGRQQLCDAAVRGEKAGGREELVPARVSHLRCGGALLLASSCPQRSGSRAGEAAPSPEPPLPDERAAQCWFAAAAGGQGE